MINKLIKACEAIKEPERTVLFLSTHLHNMLKNSIEDSTTKLSADAKVHMSNVEIRKGIHLDDYCIAEVTYFNGEIKSLKSYNLNK